MNNQRRIHFSIFQQVLAKKKLNKLKIGSEIYLYWSLYINVVQLDSHVDNFEKSVLGKVEST